MGNIFRLERAPQALAFSGERFTTAVRGQLEIEHLHRYFVARDFCRGKAVLDVASGEGYGAALLSQTAASVIGLELDPETVSHAQKTYVRTNLSFAVASAPVLPVTTGSIDVVVSFETLEHIEDQEEFLAEIRRVLRPDGMLIISTPDRDIYSPAGTDANPFHVRELSRQEFRTALEGVFSNVAVYGQRTLAGSAIVDESGPAITGRTLTFDRRGDDRVERDCGLPRAVYLIAFASAANLPALFPTSLYIERSDLDSSNAKLQAALTDVSNLRQELDSLRAVHRNLEQDHSASDGRRHAAESQLVTLKAQAEEREQLRAQVESLQQSLAALKDEEARKRRLLISNLTTPAAVDHAPDRREMERALQFYKAEYEKAISSRSWKITRPLRSGTILATRIKSALTGR